jgi:Ca-activated chloride channel homolog
LSFEHFGFSSPRNLIALLVLPLLFVFASVIRRRRSRYSVSFTNFDLLVGVATAQRARWQQRMPLVVIALALAACVAAFARPHVELTASNRGVTIVLLADVSGSMQATDVYPERIYAAIVAMRDFIAALPKGDRVGLVTFSDNAEVIDAPTTDYGAVESGLNVLSPEGGTALGTGIQTAVESEVSSLATIGVHHVPGRYLPAAIVLESDGAQDRGTVTPLAAAQLAKAAGIRIFGVALGTRHGYITAGAGVLKETYQVTPDPGTVALLARVSGGQAYDATNAPALDTIYRHLGLTIGTHRTRSDLSSWFELAAVILLLIGVGAARGRAAALP